MEGKKKVSGSRDVELKIKKRRREDIKRERWNREKEEMNDSETTDGELEKRT